MQKIVITGSSGFVGTNLKNMFKDEGFEVITINRDDLKNIPLLSTIIDGALGVINLAGANIINRWTDSYKDLLYKSRIITTKALVEAMQITNKKPQFFISTSAIGIYNNKKQHTEEDGIYSNDFLSKLCQDWEYEALRATDLKIRTTIFRFGIVLGKGGALAKMLPAFKLGLGGTIGDGTQSFSFIHIKDLLKAYKFIIDNKDLFGIFNLTAPLPTTNYGLTKALGKSLNRPTILPIPPFILDLIFSEGSKVLTDGQQAVPKRLLDNRFEFEFENIENAIENLV